MLSNPFAAVQSTTSASGVCGNGAVSRPSFIGRLRRGGDRRPVTQRPRALGDRVVDEHLVVAVGERRVGGREEGAPAATSA